MSFSAMGDKPLSQDLEITKQFAFGLEALLKQHLAKNARLGDMEAEAILAQAALITDRLTDLVPLAAEVEAGAARRPQLKEAA